MTILEMKDSRFQKENELESIIDKIEEEGRKMNEEEQTKYDTLKSEIKELSEKIDNAKKQEVKEVKDIAPEVKVGNDRSHGKDFSLINLLNGMKTGELSENELKVVKAAKEEHYKTNADKFGGYFIPMSLGTKGTWEGTTNTQGGYAVPTNTFDLINPLRDANVAVRAGAQLITGMTSNIEYPVNSGATMAWKGEVSASSDAAGTLTQITFSPKRLTGYMRVSNTLLEQTNPAFELQLRQDLVNAINEEIEETIFGSHAAASEKPNGFFTGYATGSHATAGDVGLSTIGAFKKALMGQNAYTTDSKWITNANGYNLLETTAKDSGSGIFLLSETEKVLGSQLLMTNAIPTITGTEGVVFGSWTDYMIFQWGNLSIQVDPYSRNLYNETQFVVNMNLDFGERRDASFVTGSIK